MLRSWGHNCGFIDVKVKRVVGLFGVMGVAVQGLFPVNNLAHILDQGFTRLQVHQSENAAPVDARVARLDAGFVKLGTSQHLCGWFGG